MDEIGGMKLIDNVNQTLRDELRAEIKSGSKVSVAAASFSIYAYQELKKELEQCDEFRFIFTAPTFVTEKTKGSAKFLPREISFGDESFFTEIPSRELKKISSGDF